MIGRIRRPISLLLSVLIGVLGVAAVFAVLDEDEPREGIADLNTFEGVTPTPEVVPQRDAESGFQLLHNSAPEAAETIQVWLAGDVDAAVGSIRSEFRNCSDSGSGGKTLCDWLSLPEGTQVELFLPSSGTREYAIPGQEARRLVQHLLVGRRPTLLFVAASETGDHLVGLSIIPAVPFDYGGSHPTSNPASIAVYLTIRSDGVVSNLNELSRGSPPLEPLRQKLRAGESWEVLGASAAFRDWEAEVYATVEAGRR